MRKLKPDIVFSKGGFVSVPVVLAAKHKHIPVIIHESDMTPGLANRIAIPAAQKVCCNFPETLNNLPAEKAVLTGSPIRSRLLSGDRKKALAYTGLDDTRPVILIIGGSTGSKAINEAIRASLPDILKSYHVIHLCGSGNLDGSCREMEGYVQYEYANEELSDLFALSDIVISRAGANSICELLALRKPNILIPLPTNASRGDQILNAESFARQGFSYVLYEEDLTPETLITAIDEVRKNRDKYIEVMGLSDQMDAVTTITDLIGKTRKQ